MINKLQYLSNSDKSGDRKTFVATIVVNVATERIWLETTALNQAAFYTNFSTVVSRVSSCPKVKKNWLYVI
jgi:hypothetical protein